MYKNNILTKLSEEYYYLANNTEIFWLSSFAFMIPRNLSQTGPHTSWDDLSCLGSRTFKYPTLGSCTIIVSKAIVYP